MKNLLNKYIPVDDTDRPKPKPNKDLLRQIKSRSVGFMTREEQQARKRYLDEFKFREQYNDEDITWH